MTHQRLLQQPEQLMQPESQLVLERMWEWQVHFRLPVGD